MVAINALFLVERAKRRLQPAAFSPLSNFRLALTRKAGTWKSLIPMRRDNKKPRAFQRAARQSWALE
jgi:hypothetical protein